jgi:hypothetical protein
MLIRKYYLSECFGILENPAHQPHSNIQTYQLLIKKNYSLKDEIKNELTS